MAIEKVRIIGAGLIGTSIGMALRQKGLAVEISDIDPESKALAKDLLESSDIPSPDLIIVAVPMSEVFPVLEEQYLLNPNSILMDVGSTKHELQVKVEQLSGFKSNFIGTHPMAGREVSGPSGARADLFAGRAWAVITSDQTSDYAKGAAQTVIEHCGATYYEMSAEYHDQTVSVISHLPQILSSVLAAQLTNLSDEQLNLAGQGLRDVSRLASSDTQMWLDILLSNREFIVQVLNSMGESLDRVLTALVENNASELRRILNQGKSERNRISGKHGARAREYSFVNVVLGDKPGQLGSLFLECSNIGVNVEDITLEHSPGQETGLITLALSKFDAAALFDHLKMQNWQVHRV